MSRAPQSVAPPAAWPMYRASVSVGLLCGLLIVSVFEMTRPIIARNKALALQEAIFRVLPDATSSETFRVTDDQRFELLDPGAEGEQLVYAGYDDQRRLVGVAVEAQGMGYQDVIHVMYGYSFARDAIIGIRVLESKETPGLGDRIEKDAAFLENFHNLDVSLNPAGTEPLHPIEAVKHGAKKNDWEVDGITGATISSVAIASLLRESTAYWIPRIHRRLDDFREAS
jgi:electron transport complex protein RnfG